MVFFLLLTYWGYIMQFFKWFWTNISFRKWTFEGSPLANPFLMILRIVLMPFILLSILSLCGLLVLVGNTYIAKSIWNITWPF